MGWATWAGIGVGSSRTDVLTSGQTLARDRSLEGYQPQFDGLRALAVLTVMVDHFSADVRISRCRTGSILAQLACASFWS